MSPVRRAKTMLRVGGTLAATVDKYVGGEPYAEVVNEPGGLLPYAKKHIGDLHFADVQAEVSLDAHPALFRWIRDAWFGNPDREKVALDTLVDGGQPQTLELAHATITEVVLPALESESRDRRYLGLKFTPRGVRRVPGPVRSGMAREERDFLAHNFTVDLGGLDCSGVLAVDAITVQTQFAQVGSRKKPVLVFPDLHLHVEHTRADAFREWFEDFVIGGHNDDEQERDGTITYMEPMQTEPLAVLQLFHVGIFRIADEPLPPKGPPRVQVDLYCERMELTASAGVSGSTDRALKPVKP
ncbi:MAG: hypothetical protein ABR567_11375 [Myxococcales bacterium]|nr:hypothetical protein [Myxococcales bacterium]